MNAFKFSNECVHFSNWMRSILYSKAISFRWATPIILNSSNRTTSSKGRECRLYPRLYSQNCPYPTLVFAPKPKVRIISLKRSRFCSAEKSISFPPTNTLVSFRIKRNRYVTPGFTLRKRIGVGFFKGCLCGVM